jgi:hypothetical protein
MSEDQYFRREQHGTGDGSSFMDAKSLSDLGPAWDAANTDAIAMDFSKADEAGPRPGEHLTDRNAVLIYPDGRCASVIEFVGMDIWHNADEDTYHARPSKALLQGEPEVVFKWAEPPPRSVIQGSGMKKPFRFWD